MPLGSKNRQINNPSSSNVEWEMSVTFTDGKTSHYTINQPEKEDIITSMKDNESGSGFLSFDTSDGDGAAVIDFQCIRDIFFSKI